MCCFIFKPLNLNYPLKLFVSIFLFLFLSTRLSAQCKDSSFRLKYTFTQNRMYVENFKRGNNNTSLFCGNLFHQSETVSSMVLGKINSSGKLIWGKYFSKDPIAENCVIQ